MSTFGTFEYITLSYLIPMETNYVILDVNTIRIFLYNVNRKSIIKVICEPHRQRIKALGNK